MKLSLSKEDERFDLEKLFNLTNLHTYLVVNSASFLKIEKETLIELLESESLLIDEIDLFSACFRWMNANLISENKEPNLANQIELFNSFKHLIRFPIMSRDEFFGIAQQPHKQRSSEFEIIVPAKTGLFTSGELNEFERFFETDDPKTLSTNYKLNKRDALKIGRLDYDWKTFNYIMAKDDEDIYDIGGDFVYRNGDGRYTDNRLVEGQVTKGSFVYKDEDGHYTDDLLKQANRRSIRTRLHRFEMFEDALNEEFDDDLIEESDDDLNEESDDDLNEELDDDLNEELDADLDLHSNPVSNDKSSNPKLTKSNVIYIYKMQRTSGNDEFENAIKINVFDQTSHANTRLTRNVSAYYCKNTISYHCFDPIPLVAGRRYHIKTSYNSRWNQICSAKFKVKSIKLNKDGKLDVQINMFSCENPPAWKIYFMYK